MVFAIAGLGKWVDEGGVLDKATFESAFEGGETPFPEFTGLLIHAINAMMVIPALALLLLIVSFLRGFGGRPGGPVWCSCSSQSKSTSGSSGTRSLPWGECTTSMRFCSLVPRSTRHIAFRPWPHAAPSSRKRVFLRTPDRYPDVVRGLGPFMGVLVPTG
jgi:hypothetical protein